MEFEDKQSGEALKAWRDSVNEQAERPDWFWTRQHARTMSAIKESRGGVPLFAWGAIAATIALAIGLMLPESKPPVAAVPPTQATAHREISDHDLMVALERTMNSGVPSSLAPAGMLADEMDQALTSQVHKQKAKEKRYED